MDEFISPSLVHYSICLFESTSVFANALVIWLALSEKDKGLQDYKRIITLNCVIDISCTTIVILTQPQFEFVESLWVHKLNGVAGIYASKNVRFILTGSYAFYICLNMTSMIFPFVFRYYLIVRGRRLSNLKLSKWAIFPLSSATYCGIAFGIAAYVSDWKYIDRSFLYNNKFLFNSDTPEPIIVIIDLTTVPVLVGVIGAIVFACVMIGIIGYCTLHTYRELNKRRAQAHTHTLRLQRQMNLVLFTQMISVFIAAILPLAFMLGLMIAKQNAPSVGSLITIIMSFLPSINPLSTMVLVHRFRRRTLQLVCLKLFYNKVNDKSEGLPSENNLRISTIVF